MINNLDNAEQFVMLLKEFNDPAPTLEKVNCPVLALNGSKDFHVPPEQNLTAIKMALEKGGNQNVTVKELPKLNHFF